MKKNQLSFARIIETLPASEEVMKTEARRKRFEKRALEAHEKELAEVERLQALENQISLVFEAKKRPGRPKGSKAEPNHNTYTWTDEDILLVMDALLHQTSKAFDSDTSESERTVILGWVAEPIVPRSANPFSFAACCAAFGLDAEELQKALLYHAEAQELLVEEKGESPELTVVQ
ncbi:hypothetical protein [Thioalkalivibrio sp. ALE16]|uniref:hypothetical protein n=1 Tax=Thioalkalivibrio sp. ALE16 TaxID=1158172 RepID=UPI00037E11AA|nr:hypothetical protein [Thioalkalivibrio sp. ALE16]